MVYENGDKYSGQWKEGKKDGFGIYLLNGKKMKLKGEWSCGELKFGKWFLENGDFYEGKFENGFPFGDGKWVRGGGMVDFGRYEHESVGEGEEIKGMEFVKNPIYKEEVCKVKTVWVSN